MKLKFNSFSVVFSVLVSAAAIFAAKPKIWLSDGTFVYHAENHKIYTSGEQLAVFADKSGCFYIFDNVGKTNLKTFSASKFVRELSLVSGRHYFNRIAVLNFPGADNEKIEEVLNNANLFQFVEYDFSENKRYARVKILEYPKTELNFYYAG